MVFSFVVVGIDWLSFSIPLITTSEVLAPCQKLCNIFGTEGSVEPGRPINMGTTYESSYIFGIPIKGGYRFSQRIAKGENLTRWEKRIGDAHFSISADILKSISPESIHELIQWIVLERGGHLSRIDLCIDFPLEFLSESDWLDGIREGKLCGLKKARKMESYDSGEYRGVGWGLGSRESEKFVRLYDKAAEQGDSENFGWRLESEFKKIKARELGKIISESDWLGFINAIPSIICGCLDFRELDNSRTSRRSRSEFWQAFLDRLEANPFKIICERTRPTIERTLNWMQRCFQRALAKSRLALGESEYKMMLHSLLNQGMQKLSNLNYLEIQQYLANAGREGYDILEDIGLLPQKKDVNFYGANRLA